jgi:transporter family-2 protein
MFGAFAPLVGALITIMNDANSRFSVLVGSFVAALVIHMVGLAAVSAVLLVRREEKVPGRLPFYYYLGGFVGVGTVFSNNYAFAALGASLAVAFALLGQTLLSLAVDVSGFLGRRKYPLSARNLPGIALAVTGVAVMAGNLRSGAFAMLVALASGLFTGLSFILNSELGRRKGIFRSTRVNYMAGLATTLTIIAALRPTMAASARAVAAAGPFLALGGGLMGVAVVAAANLIFPRIPAFSATILMFSGQALCGVLVDFLAQGALDLRKLAGTLVLLAGLAINALLSKRGEGEKRPRPAK